MKPNNPAPRTTNRWRYRLRQVRQQLGFIRPLNESEIAEVRHWLPETAIPLFETMSHADQQHSLRVCRGLEALGCQDAEMLAAALLHDVGKAQKRVPFWTRPAIVLGKLLAPRLIPRLVFPADLLGGGLRPHWRRSLSFAWWHAEIGARLAAAGGLSEQTVLYIRTHHQPDGPAHLLHLVDEES
jgi:hypothetical protein